MLSLLSFLREWRVVGLCWAQSKPKGPKAPRARWNVPSSKHYTVLLSPSKCGPTLRMSQVASHPGDFLFPFLGIMSGAQVHLIPVVFKSFKLGRTRPSCQVHPAVNVLHVFNAQRSLELAESLGRELGVQTDYVYRYRQQMLLSKGLANPWYT